MARTKDTATALPDMVEIIVTGDGRQRQYGLNLRGRDYLYTTDADGIVRVPAGDEAELFLHYVDGAAAIRKR